ncbi:S8 family peptidase [Clostridium sp. LP20]|uniref:S8 family peptidase n=1 Tax=Clostridium sp. LP20 TaxID=3418665 RepID=UPI003EE635CF
MANNAVPEFVFMDEVYKHYMVQYQGDIEGDILRYPEYYVTIVDEKYAIISTKSDIDLEDNYGIFPSIIFVAFSAYYTLQDIDLVSSEKPKAVIFDSPLKLTGEGTIVALIGTGIDYISETFMDENGMTRIEGIWDQTILSKEDNRHPNTAYGSYYTRDKINEAIRVHRNGGDPYSIVPSKDDTGYGTSMASVIGGDNKKLNFKGMSPKCSFIVVKLIEAQNLKKRYGIEIPIYNLTSIIISLKFLYEYGIERRKPLSIYFPLETNSGNHKGSGLLEEYIESIAMSMGIVVISGTGNEGANGGHTFGVINAEGEMKTIQLDVDKPQKYLETEIWIDVPNIMTLEVISPSGESTGRSPTLLKTSGSYNYIFEDTRVTIKYFMPELTSGDELIRIIFENIVPGIWQFRLTGRLISDGIFNAWLPQKGITLGETRFRPFDPYGTSTNPSNSRYLVSAAAYNQMNNNIVNFSGVASLDDYIDRIDVAAPGVKVLTVTKNNKLTSVSGTAVSAAVVTGVCALLFEWGVVNGNNRYLFAQTLKAYIDRGTYQRKGDIYPNPQWGYGILDVFEIFRNMT